MNERSCLENQYEIMFNECVKFSESTVFDVTRDPNNFAKIASLYQSLNASSNQSQSEQEKSGSTGDHPMYTASEVDGFVVCESKVPFIDVFSSVL